jgi:hypothetical protein
MIIWALIGALIAVLVLRGCVREWTGLPSEVEAQIERQYMHCIGLEETPIWPGEPRQPECGRVDIVLVGRGVVPPTSSGPEVTRAVCYRVSYSTPRWSTLGTTRHEIAWHERTAGKVALFLDGRWDAGLATTEAEDEQRWYAYACPGDYLAGEAGS